MILNYNGYAVPDISAVFSEGYAVLTLALGLVVTDKPLVKAELEGSSVLMASEETTYQISYLSDDAWTALSSGSTLDAGEAACMTDGVAWANYDIENYADGTVWFEKTQPSYDLADGYLPVDGQWVKKAFYAKQSGKWMFADKIGGHYSEGFPIPFSFGWLNKNTMVNIGTEESPQYVVKLSEKQLTAYEMKRLALDVYLFGVNFGLGGLSGSAIETDGHSHVAGFSDLTLVSLSEQGELYEQFASLGVTQGLWALYETSYMGLGGYMFRRMTTAEEKFYRYGDQCAPPMPEYDAEKYVYAAVGEIPFDCFDQNLIVASAPPNGLSWEGVENLSYIIYENDGASWVEKYRLDDGTGDDSIQFTNGKVTWCNTDTYDSDGVLVTAASEPTPVLDETGSIYGVSWDMSSNAAMTRTDAAAGFSAPVPSVGGAAGSSPFDSLMPWSGMQIVEDEYGSWVSIPKFWYKITQTDSAFQIQIADYAADGFSVSPAHADRGDGSGERDTVYIARYKSTIGTAKPVSGAAPMVSITRDYLRTELAKNGVATIQDYAMLWTTRMLMVVEYATWDMQGAIGYNCGNGSSAENTGSTDDMPYHTGTVQAALTTYGVGVQYRYIEDPWGNVAEWVDGWRMDDDGNIYIITNPAEYSDTEGGTLVGARTSTYGYITGWTVPTAEGFDWALIPQMSGSGSGTEYVADDCYLNGPALVVGGSWYAYRGYGPFCLSASSASVAGADVGARLQKIP